MGVATGFDRKVVKILAQPVAHVRGQCCVEIFEAVENHFIAQNTA